MAVEVFRVKGTTTGTSPIVLGWQFTPTANTVAGGLRETTINNVAQGNVSTAFLMPYSIATFGRRSDSYGGASTYNRRTVYSAPAFPDTYDGTNTNANNANITGDSGILSWGDYEGADNRGQLMGSGSFRVTVNQGGGKARERSSHWKMAVRTEGNITGYHSGVSPGVYDGGSYRSLSNSRMYNDTYPTTQTRLWASPIADSEDGRHTPGQVPYDTGQQRFDASEVLTCAYNADTDQFYITVAGNFNYNNQTNRLHLAGTFLVEAFDSGNTRATGGSSYGTIKTTKFLLSDASISYGTSSLVYSKFGHNNVTNVYPNDNTTSVVWSNVTVNPFYDTVTNTGHSESTSAYQWNALVYPLRT